jgi:hypothetical protein
VFLDTLVDNVHGDLFANGLCPPPQPLFAGRDPYRCVFEAFVGGDSGDEERNTVTAGGVDDDGLPVSGSAQATVAVLGVPPSITTTKRAVPSSVPEPGGPVLFEFTTTNTSKSDVVTLDSLVDSVFGELDGRGDCSVPQVLSPGESYFCQFEAEIEGLMGQTHFDEVLTEGTSLDGDAVASRASAIVRFTEALEGIPTLGRWGVAVLLVLVVGLGLYRLRP